MWLSGTEERVGAPVRCGRCHNACSAHPQPHLLPRSASLFAAIMAAATRMRATCAVPRAGRSTAGVRGGRRAAARAVTGAPGAEVSTGAASDFSDERLLEMTVAFNDAQRGAKDPSLLGAFVRAWGEPAWRA